MNVDDGHLDSSMLCFAKDSTVTTLTTDRHQFSDGSTTSSATCTL